MKKIIIFIAILFLSLSFYISDKAHEKLNKDILGIVYEFEGHIQASNPEKAFEMIAQPTTDDEISWHSHLKGLDLPGENNYRLKNNVYRYKLASYEIVSSSIKDEIGTVVVDEFRILPTQDETGAWKYVDESKQVLVFGLIREDGVYRIESYAHENLPENISMNKKYEGFSSERLAEDVQTEVRSECEKLAEDESLITEEYGEIPSEIDYALYPEAENYKTVIGKFVDEGVNFAGHYVFATWGCGANCFSYAIIDSTNGKVVAYSGAVPNYVLPRVSLKNNTFVLNPIYKGQEVKYMRIIENDGAVKIEEFCTEIAENDAYVSP